MEKGKKISEWKQVAIYSFLLLAFGVPNSLFAQQYIRCVSSEYWKQREQADPSLLDKKNSFSTFINQWLTRKTPNRQQQTITVPVVIHIVYNSAAENIPDNVVQSQIDVINQDYSRLNTDTVQTPLIWRSIAGNPEIQFCLAQRTPNGQPTSGIERRATMSSNFDYDDRVKFDTSGGMNSWNSNEYLNIWVCNLTGNKLGYTASPYYNFGTGKAYDGVVITYTAFGSIGSVLNPEYAKGRTATHEIGHWLGLTHPWGDDGGDCLGTDSISDTPNEGNNVYGCPAYPYYDGCSSSYPGVMFMNYMDYTDDACMNMFTDGQVQKMLAVMNVVRPSIPSSPSCLPVNIHEVELKQFIQTYPNPASDVVYIQTRFPEMEDVEIRLTDILGATVFSKQYKDVFSETITVPLSSIASGIYELTVLTKDGIGSQKVSVIR